MSDWDDLDSGDKLKKLRQDLTNLQNQVNNIVATQGHFRRFVHHNIAELMLAVGSLEEAFHRLEESMRSCDKAELEK